MQLLQIAEWIAHRILDASSRRKKARVLPPRQHEARIEGHGLAVGGLGAVPVPIDAETHVGDGERGFRERRIRGVRLLGRGWREPPHRNDVAKGIAAVRLIQLRAGEIRPGVARCPDCLLETETFGEMAGTLRGLAAELGAPVLVCLEGGYALEALADSVSATIAGLSGSARPRAAPEEPASEHLMRLREGWATLPR